MRKHAWTTIGLLAASALILAACGGGATPAATEAPIVTEAPVETEAPPVAGEPAECASDSYGCAVIHPGETIKIGMGAPMTGDNADFGIDISQGALLAVQDFGEFQGFQFELAAQDDQGAPEGGAAVANLLVSDPTTVAIEGHIFSGATEAAMPIYEEAGLPMLSPSATRPDLTQKGSPVFNRVAFTDADQGRFAAEYLYNTLSIRNLAVMHDGQAFGQGLAEVVTAEFTALGGTVVATEAVTPGETDYSAILAAIAAAGPEGIYFGGYTPEAAVIVNQMGTAGMQGVVFFGCDGTFGQNFLTLTGANGEGAYGTALIPPSSAEKDAFDAAYEAQFGIGPGVLSPYSWNAYDAAGALIYAVKSVAILGGDGNLYIPRGALVDAVRHLADYQGISGTITCSEVGECNASGPTFYMVQNGEWVVAPH